MRGETPHTETLPEEGARVPALMAYMGRKLEQQIIGSNMNP
jgi:hypothetical protein